MDFEQAQHYLSQKPEAELSYPFDPDVMVFKVMNKIVWRIPPILPSRRALHRDERLYS